jgi:hypothetical protein
MRRVGDRLLVFFIVFQLIFPASIARAGAKPSVAVPPLSGAMDDRARNGLANALRNTGTVSMIETSAIDNYLKDRQSRAIKQPKKDNSASSDLKKGIDLYRNLEIDKAISKLTNVKTRFRESLSDPASFENLRVAQIYLGMAYLAKRERSRAKDELKTAVILDPERKTRKLPEKFYPSDIRKLFEEARADVLKKEKGELEVTTSTGGEIVYVDGKSIGTAPTRVNDLPVGEHFVRVEGEGRIPYFAPQTIVSGENRLLAELKSLSNIDVDKLFGTVQQTSDIDHERVAFLDEMGLALGIDMFVFLTPEQGAVRAQLYDQRSQDISPSVREKSPEALAALLIKQIGADGYIRPQTENRPSSSTDVQSSDRPLAENLKPKDETSLSQQASRPLVDSRLPGDPEPWYKNHWIWIGVGAAVLIGGGAALLMTSKKGSSNSTLTLTVPGK